MLLFADDIILYIENLNSPQNLLELIKLIQ